MSDFAASPRIKDPMLLRLLKFQLDECEITGVTHDLHLHHVIFKSHSGDDLRENIICLTEAVHTLYHQGNPRVRLLIARHVDDFRPDVACYIAEKLGGADPLLEWFSRHGLGSPVDTESRGVST